ncbi:MAG: Crp/Fnr family transcriptional regulator [Candidatus Limnocylindria bacterium]
MSQDAKIAFLRGVPLFAGLDTHQLERLGMLADEVDLPEGRVLMREGEIGNEMMVLVDGTVRVERDGRLIAERGSGETMGELSLIDHGQRTATVTLTAPSRLLVVGHREFHTLMDEFPEVKMRVLESLARRLRTLDTERCL